MFLRRWTNAPFLWNAEEDGRTYKGWMWESTGGIDLTSRLITEADCDPDWINQYWDYEGRYQRFICWDENNNKPTYWDAEQCVWEGERHRIPTTGTWIEHPYKPVIADAWLPDPSHFADPADPAYDAYWNEVNLGGAKSNPLGLPQNPALFPGGVPTGAPTRRAPCGRRPATACPSTRTSTARRSPRFRPTRSRRPCAPTPRA